MLSSSILAASLNPWSGSGCTSKNHPVAPKAFAANAMAGTKRRSPVVVPLPPPGRCTELDGKPFKYFEAHRAEWALDTCYTYPGAIQYYGPAEVCDLTTRTLALEKGEN